MTWLMIILMMPNAPAHHVVFYTENSCKEATVLILERYKNDSLFKPKIFCVRAN